MSVPDPVPIVDGLMTATAKMQGTTSVTHNTADVQCTGVELLESLSS